MNTNPPFPPAFARTLSAAACQRFLLSLMLAILALLTGPFAHSADFLEPEKAFRFSARLLDSKNVEIRFDIEPGYYLYRKRFAFAADGATLGAAQIPPGKVKFDETFRENVETHRGDLRIRLAVTSVAGAAWALNVTSQGCADAGLCYPPMTSTARLTMAGAAAAVATDPAQPPSSASAIAASPVPAGTALASVLQGQVAPLPTATPAAPNPGRDANAGSAAATTPATESGTIARVFSSGRLLSVLAVFFVLGLLLSFTPCVLPMLPILSSIIVGGRGQASTRLRGLALAASYSLGMATVYTALGVVAGLAGEGLAAALQTAWVQIGFALLLFAFSLSMFDVYELRLPGALAERLSAGSQRLPAGQLVGVFLMGGVSAAIVSPCITAPLAGALLFISQSRDVVLGGSALFAMAAGMSVPLLLLGASAGAWLPASGAWMIDIKRIFGVLLIATAIWTARAALPAVLLLTLCGSLAVGIGFMVWPQRPPTGGAAPGVWARRTAAAVAMALGLMQLVGAASGGSDPVQPLSHLAVARVAATSATASPGEGPRFALVRSVAELDAAIAGAGKAVVLDFYADWCVSCKEMERFTFSDPTVAARLSNALLLKADVTANSAADRELLKRFQLFGPPGTIFFNRQGQEVADARVVGFENAERFNQTLLRVGL
jgi:thiol:disulfide interchange protein DsbD